MACWLRSFDRAGGEPGGNLVDEASSLAFHRLPGHDLDLESHSTLFSGEQSNSSVAFGEDALISDQPRTATARAKQDSVCFLVPQEAFESELNGPSDFLKSLVANLIRHIRSLMVQLDEASANPDAAQPDVIFHQPESFNSYKVKE